MKYHNAAPSVSLSEDPTLRNLMTLCVWVWVWVWVWVAHASPPSVLRCGGNRLGYARRYQNRSSNKCTLLRVRNFRIHICSILKSFKKYQI